MRRHIRKALELGASREEIMAVLQLTSVLGIHTMSLGAPILQEELAAELPGCTGLNVVESIYGHDGFLVETEAVGRLIRHTLDCADAEGARRP